MDKIEELHKGQLFVIDNPSGDKDGDKSYASKLCAAVTEDIAIKFAVWCTEKWKCINGLDGIIWVYSYNDKKAVRYTTTELFNEFKKTL